jgi:cytochrome c
VRRALLLCAAAVVLAGCGGSHASRVVPGSDTGRGKDLITHYGCGSCHEIAGVGGADGKVGPPLVHFGERQTVAGKLPNTPEGLIRWLMDPQQVWPGNDMPDLGVTRAEARDIVAYLYSH